MGKTKLNTGRGGWNQGEAMELRAGDRHAETLVVGHKPRGKIYNNEDGLILDVRAR